MVENLLVTNAGIILLHTGVDIEPLIVMQREIQHIPNLAKYRALSCSLNAFLS